MINPFQQIEHRFDAIEGVLNIILEHVVSPPKDTSDKDEFLTVPEAAKFLRLSVPTIYGLISKGEIPVRKRSKRCYFSAKELQEYLNQGRRKAITEITSETQSYLQSIKKDFKS